jgi:ferredoxin
MSAGTGAAGIRVSVDPAGCQRYGQCALEAPEVFALADHDPVARVLLDPVPVELVEQAETAVDLCPMQALTVVPAQPSS